MALLSPSLKITIGILLLLGLPINMLRNITENGLEGLIVVAEIAALTIILAILLWKRSKWGLIGSVGLVTLGIMLFSILNIIDILSGASGFPQILLFTEPVALGLSTLFLLFVFQVYRENP